MKTLSLIIKREFIAKVRNKSFIIMTFLSPLLFVGIAVLIGFLSNLNKDTITEIAIHDEAGLLKNSFKNDKETRYTDFSVMPFAVAKDSATKSFSGLLYIPKVDSISQLAEKVEYISEESPSINFILEVENVIDSVLTADNYKKLGIDYDNIKKAEVNASLKLAKFSGEESLKGVNEMKIAIGGMMGYLIMMFIMIYGNFVMRSVIEEKTNRIIEIIISSVKPFQLMMGKIIGNSLAGILQFLIWVIVGFVLLFVAQNVLGLQTGGASAEITQQAVETVQQQSDKFGQLQSYINEIMNLPLALMTFAFVLYFIGGYFLYSSIYAAIGAAVDSETDSQQFMLPILLPLILGVYIGFFTVVNDPHGTVATVFSIIPFTSPIVMLMRIPFGVPVWQLVLSMALLFATFALVVWIAAKIYRIGILMYGKKPSWKELYKWLRY